MPTFSILALTPCLQAEPAIAIAACRAGEIGVVDLEYCSAEVAATAVRRLAQGSDAAFGIRFGRTMLLDSLPNRAKLIIVTADNPLSPALIERLHIEGRQVWVEITAGEQIAPALATAAYGLIARGHEAGGPGAPETTFILLQRLLASTERPVLAHGGIGMHSAAACRAPALPVWCWMSNSAWPVNRRCRKMCSRHFVASTAARRCVSALSWAPHSAFFNTLPIRR
ncbi:MAG: hypothetical protein HC822_10135 [Oscillochloris sp.]|nr:hypothetical protein [Oscillochloris sp.]